MKTKQNLAKAAIVLACSSGASQIHAALPTNATLTFATQTYFCDYGLGTPPDACVVAAIPEQTYFSMDTDGDGIVDNGEKVAMAENDGLKIGLAQAASGSHGGLPGSVSPNPEQPAVDQPWNFFGNTGMHQSTSAVTIASDDGSGNVTLDMAGWSVAWNAIPNIPMGGNGAFPADTGFATLTCGNTCEDGDTFTLDYAAHVAATPASGFENVPYTLHLQGTVVVPNVAPVASNFTVTAVASTTPSVNVANNAFDADDNLDANSVAIVTDNSCGTITNNNDGTVTLPSCGASSYTFTYTIDDTLGATSNTATVTVNVSANPAPNTQADSGSTDGVAAVAIDVPNNDSDPGGSLDLTSVAIASAPAHGGTAINATTGVITYTANAGFSGVDTFTYTIDDNTAQTSAATTVFVTVNAEDVPSSNGTFSAGTTDTSGDTTDGIVTATDIGVTDSGSSASQGITQTCIGGCFDFVITSFTGNDAMVILPLSTAIPTPATDNILAYRKLDGSGNWQDFDTSGNNAIHTVPGTVGATVICPPATDASYDSSPGLTIGHQCVRLTITDGGPNDADGLVNSTVVDPGGIAETFTNDIRTWGTDGCSMSATPVNAQDRADWWLVAGFLALLGMFKLKRKV